MKLIRPISLTIAVAISLSANAQLPVTGAFTDFHGYWTSNTANINILQPDSSHMLLAFTYDGTTYSTGVNNSILDLNSVVYQPENFTSFLLANNSIAANSTTVIGVGNLYGGGSGNVNPIPVTDNLGQYLSDGTNGLNLGTALFNIPVSTMNYSVSNFNITSIGDNVPDLVVTQVGQPPTATSLDTFRFVDATGATVGNPLAVSLAGVGIVGNGSWKFYNPGTPPVYNAGLQGSRPLRMVGFDLAAFGITSLNAVTIDHFVHKLSGNSDQAFLAYNTVSFTAGTGVLLPITLTDFTADKSGNTTMLSWKTAEPRNFSHFDLERSIGTPNDFMVIANIPYANSDGPKTYTYKDKNPGTGLNYYRLKMIDIDNKSTYSTVQLVNFETEKGLVIYPNPSSNQFYLDVPDNLESITVYNVVGKVIPINVSGEGNIRILETGGLIPGLYYIHIKAGNRTIITKVLKR